MQGVHTQEIIKGLSSIDDVRDISCSLGLLLLLSWSCLSRLFWQLPFPGTQLQSEASVWLRQLPNVKAISAFSAIHFTVVVFVVGCVRKKSFPKERAIVQSVGLYRSELPHKARQAAAVVCAAGS